MTTKAVCGKYDNATVGLGEHECDEKIGRWCSDYSDPNSYMSMFKCSGQKGETLNVFRVSGDCWVVRLDWMKRNGKVRSRQMWIDRDQVDGLVEHLEFDLSVRAEADKEERGSER